ncbi:cyclic-di-GMP phosphodiesterase [compost metagenome]
MLPPPASGEAALRRLSQVLELAAGALAAWLPHGFHPSLSCPFPLALLKLDHCAQRVRRVIQRRGLHARDLTFELDLSGAGYDLHAMAPALLDLRAEELEFAVSCGAPHDGIGFAALLDVPVSELKLAPDLTDGVAFDPHVQQLVAGMVGLAKRLDIRVVATGVARPDDFATLRELGCDFMQGPVVGGLWSAAPLVRPELLRHAGVQHA